MSKNYFFSHPLSESSPGSLGVIAHLTSRLIQNFLDFWKMEGTPSTPSGGPLGAKTLQINVGEAGVFTNIAWTIRNSLART